MSSRRAPSSSSRSQTPLRLHTPQAIRPSSRVLLDDGWDPLAGAAAASPPLSAHTDFLFSDTESLFSTTSTVKSGARKKRRKRSTADAASSSPAAQILRFVSKQSPTLATPALLLAVLLVKSVISLGSFSGEGKPPLYGDLEAQRHWLSLTWHKPWSEWYFYNLEYWGLDYPPLTAFHSLFLAKVFHMLGGQDIVALRGEYTVADEATIKTWMRLSVLWTEALVWLPVVLLWSRTQAPRLRSLAALTVLLQPALILIDNGHFQYNSVMLGFTLLAQTCFHWEYDLTGAACFVFSLCYKQMALYYAPAIFAYLLGKCIARKDANLLFSIAFVTVASFALCFAPFLSSFPQLAQALHRIFPFARGLFEDKVANVWCALNVVYKLRQLLSIAALTKIALATTILAIVPGMLLMLSRPRKELLPLALANSSLAFFLFSFQVHEKSILLPLMPFTLILGASEPGSEDHSWSSFLNNAAVFSMWPLLKKDGLALQYCVLPFMWNYFFAIDPLKYQGIVKYLGLMIYTLIGLVHMAELFVPPPTRFPDIYPVLNVGISAPVFGLAYLWTLKRLAQESWAASALRAGPTAVKPPSLPTNASLQPLSSDKGQRGSHLSSGSAPREGLRHRG